MKRYFSFPILLFVAFFGFIPQARALTFDYLVPCGDNISMREESNEQGESVICYYNECSICSAQILALRIINFLIFLAVLLATGLFLNAGVLLVFSASNPGAKNSAKKMLWNVFVGLCIILGAWLAVDTIMKTLYSESGTGWGPWNEMLCKNSSEKHCVPKIGAAVLNGEEIPIPESLKEARNNTIVSLSGKELTDAEAIKKLKEAGITPKEGQPFVGVKDSTIAGVIALKQACPSCEITVTSATGGVNGAGTGHAEGSLHYQGVKLDLAPTPSVTNYIETNFTHTGDRKGSYAGPIYTNTTLGQECVHESSPEHWDCTYAR